MCDHCGLDHDGRCSISYFFQLRDGRGFVTHESIWRFEWCDDHGGVIGWVAAALPSAHDDHFADPVYSVWDLIGAMCIDPVLGVEMPYMAMEPHLV